MSVLRFQVTWPNPRLAIIQSYMCSCTRRCEADWLLYFVVRLHRFIPMHEVPQRWPATEKLYLYRQETNRRFPVHIQKEITWFESATDYRDGSGGLPNDFWERPPLTPPPHTSRSGPVTVILVKTFRFWKWDCFSKWWWPDGVNSVACQAIAVTRIEPEINRSCGIDKGKCKSVEQIKRTC